MPSATLIAPAKVNLRLKVLDRRGDGYHNLQMIMVRVGVADEIELRLTEVGFEVTCDAARLPSDPSNSVWKACEAVARESGRKFGARIHLKKRIPIAAGLGGGSSDAASVLSGLNRLLELGWESERLIEIGKKIGADVPFFFKSGPQIAEGIGDRLSPIERIPPIFIVLINPGFPLATPSVYSWWDTEAPGKALTSPKGWDNLPRFFEGLDSLLPLLENDLERVVRIRYPVINEMKEALLGAGAKGALMSGSGPTVLGIFENQSVCDAAVEELGRKKKPGWWLYGGKILGGEESNLD